jgi:hypothetical protein
MEAARMKCISHHPIAKRMRIASGIALALSICAGSGLIPEASAQTIGSFYTSTAPGHCRVSGAGNRVDDSTTRFCPGRAGLGVLVNEDDLRETVSVGRSRATAAREPAATLWFGPVQREHRDGRMACAGRQAVRDHPALAPRRQRR